MENEVTEISLLELWQKIWKNKILIIIITLFTILIGGIAVYFVNKDSSKLNNEFNVHFFNIAESKYADDSRFDYHEFMSLENLNAVKNSDEKFKDIKTQNIIKDENSLIKKVDGNNDQPTFKIIISLKHFKYDEALAKEFVNKLTNSILVKAKEKNKLLDVYNYFKDNPNMDDNNHLGDLTYSKIFSMIAEQNDLINYEIDLFIETYGDVRVKGVQVSSFKKDYNFWYNNTVYLDHLESQTKTKFYVRNLEETLRIANLNYDNLQIQIEQNNELIANLTALYKELHDGSSVIDNDSYISREIGTAVMLNEQLKFEQSYYALILDENTQLVINEEFESIVNNIVIDLSDFTNQLNQLQNDYLDDNVYYSYTNDLEFEVTNNYSLILMLVVFALLGGSIGVVTSLIKESNSKKILTINN